MTYQLRDFIFTDDDEKCLAEMGLVDEDVTYQYAQRLANEHQKNVHVLEELTIVEPVNIIPKNS